LRLRFHFGQQPRDHFTQFFQILKRSRKTAVDVLDPPLKLAECGVAVLPELNDEVPVHGYTQSRKPFPAKS
jgi:hypothetical protein